MESFILVSDVNSYFFEPKEFIPFNKSPHDLASEINIRIQNSPEDSLVFNLEALFKKSFRQNHIILEVIFFLRCKYRIPNPIICIGFESLSDILYRKPENLIICSPGVKYLRNPVTGVTLEEQIVKLRKDNIFLHLRKFLRSALNVEQLRHHEANWWGAYQLLNTHNVILKSDSLQPLSEKTILSNRVLNHVNSVESSIAQYIYNSNGNILESADSKGANYLENKILSLDPLPRILYIDDMAQTGWGKILQEVIFRGVNDKSFKMIAPRKGEDLHTIWQTIFTKIIKFRPDCILLDLRLQNEEERAAEVENLSGAQILKLLKSELPSLPVIMFTASNKARSLKKLYNLGCDYMWTKEGVDEINDGKTSLRNYLELIDLIFDAATKFRDETDKKLYAAEVKLSKVKRDYSLKLKSLINIYDVILTDSNIWLNKRIEKVQQSLFILMNGCKELSNAKFVVIDQVFDEIIRISKEKLDSEFVNYDGTVSTPKERLPVRKTARWVEPVLQKYYDQNLLVKGLNIDGGNRRERYNRFAYADKVFITEIIPKYLEAGLSVLFISDDVRCKSAVRRNIRRELVAKYADFNSTDLVKTAL